MMKPRFGLPRFLLLQDTRPLASCWMLAPMMVLHRRSSAATMPPPLLLAHPSAAVGSGLQTTATVEGQAPANTWSPTQLGPTLGEDYRSFGYSDHAQTRAPGPRSAGAASGASATPGPAALPQSADSSERPGIASTRREETYTGTPASARPGRDSGSPGPTPMSGLPKQQRHGGYSAYSPPDSVSSRPRGRSRDPPGYPNQRINSSDARPAASRGAADWSRDQPATARDAARGSPAASSVGSGVASAARTSGDASMQQQSVAEPERARVPSEDAAESAVFAALRGFNPQRAEELQRKLRERQAAKERAAQ
mmetsp:Transcript_6376/g.15483  ORF Transcript_6376/g.15483 Transcript_6376/m.15483 type:complete len:310 (+) Transcript_6376:52-981(+)